MRDCFWRALGHSRLPFAESLLWRAGIFGHSRAKEFQIPWRGLSYHGNLIHWVDRYIYFVGAYAPAELDFLKHAALVLRRLGEHVTMLDIGANVGQHSLALHRYVDRVIAFEPSREASSRLRDNVTLNKITNVEIHDVALGQLNEEAQLGSGLPGNDGSRSLNWSLQGGSNTYVPVRHAGDYLRGIRPDVGPIGLIKLDVEGHEKAVLTALRSDLQRDRPIIMFELVGQRVKGGFDSAEELRDAMYDNHVLFGLEGRRRARLRPFAWDEHEEAVCMPLEHVTNFRAMIH